ncbi:ABC transporter permease [Streptomyces sp. NEAU-Y11]|uniref:ABC transporter permease n=1 Tax=Streptomyces cucumeris TaxID=2962890 RepID=UPI0020C8B8C2|nr:ABC transporter permease [Streptomyces sp. NEAU-Y11]MCP9206438.1 ABC transporter permease [Streptomyces sp. NEAU-Y11]
MPHVLSDTVLVFGRYARQTLRSTPALVFGLVQPLLFLVFFGPLLEDLPLSGDGDSWQLVVPGILIQLGLFSASFTGIGLVLEKRLAIVERMRVTPVSRLALLMGRVLKDVVQLLVQSLVLVAVAVVMGLRAPVLGVVIGFVFVAVLTVSLASLSYALAMRVATPQEFAPVINAVTMPAMLLSGVLLPMSLAPDWLDAVSHAVPFRYLVDGVRAAFAGEYGDGRIAVAALVATGLAVVAVTLGARLFRQAGA